VAARFEVRGRLGAGPHGAVLEAEDTHLGLRAAVKLVPVAPGDGGRLVEALGVLVDTLRELDAPALAVAYDVGLVGEAEGAGVYVATELAPLGSVAAFPRASAPLVAAWTLELLDALEACHLVGLTHGHVAPTNALVEAEADGTLHARLVDVGLAPVVSRRPPALDVGMAQDVRDLALLALDLLAARGAVDWARRRAAAPLPFRPDVAVPASLRALFEHAAANPAWGDARALRDALAPLAALHGGRHAETGGAVVAPASERPSAPGDEAEGEGEEGEGRLSAAQRIAAARALASTWAALSRATTARATLDALAGRAAALCGATGLAVLRRAPSGEAVSVAGRGQASRLDTPAVYEAARAVADGAAARLVPTGGVPATGWAAVVPFTRGENVEVLAVCWPAPEPGAHGDGDGGVEEAPPPPTGRDGKAGEGPAGEAPARDESPSGGAVPLGSAGHEAAPARARACLPQIEVLAALGAAVAERAAARDALLDETATRAALMDMAGDALVLLGPGGIIRGLTPAAAEVLDVHREAAVGRELSSLRGLGALGRVLRWARAVDGEVVAVAGGQLLVRSQPVDGGAVVQLELLRPGNRPASGSWQRRRGLEHVVGSDPALVAAVRKARRAAAHSRPLLIEGEPGTGRKLLAEAVHRTSGRAEGPFLVFRAAAIPAATHAQVLLGVEGARGPGGRGSARPGKLSVAHGGTLVIERPDCLPREVQEVLRRVVAHGYGTPLGGGAKFPADVRLIAITEVPLEVAVREGRCGEELARLLGHHRVRLPPLRERAGDIPALLKHAIRGAAQAAGRAPLELAPEVLSALTAYEWPGNVRELVQLADAWMTLLPPETTTIERVPAHIGRALSLTL